MQHMIHRQDDSSGVAGGGGGVMQPPQAAASEGRRNEYFRFKKYIFYSQKILNHKVK